MMLLVGKRLLHDKMKNYFFDNAFLKIVFFIVIYMSIFMFTKENIFTFLKFYLITFLIILFLYFSFSKYGESSVEKIYMGLMFILNLLAILNIYQMIFKRPILINYLNLLENSYSYNFGTSLYRTFSVFGHPIIAGIFFSALFFINHYLMNSNIKYLLQIIVLMNIYSTMSRSSWIAFLMGLVILIGFRFSSLNGKTSIMKKNVTYKRLVYILISFLIIGIGLLMITPYLSGFMTQIVSRFGDSISKNSTDYSNLQRTETIKLVVRHMLKSNFINLIFGNGFNTSSSFMVANPIFIKGFSSTDNTYLSILFEYGLLGVLFLLYLIIKLIYKFFTISKTNRIYELSFICTVVISVNAFFFEISGWPTVSIFLAFCLSVLFFPFQRETNETN